VEDGRLVVPISGANASLTLTLSDVNDTRASITSIVLNVEQNYTVNEGGATLQVSAGLNDVPLNASLNISVLPPSAVNMTLVNDVLQDSGRQAGTPLCVIDVSKVNLANGVDVGWATFNITIPVPSGFDPSAPYYVVRQGDDANEVLNATVVAMAGNEATFQVVSPHGFSTFTLVEATSPSPTPMPTSFSIYLRSGWNLVSSPLVLDGLNTSVFQGTGVTMAARYNRATSGFDVYRVGKTPVAFPIVAGEGYFLYCNGDMQYTFHGHEEQSQAIMIGQGWNLVGWTSQNTSNALEMANRLQNVTMIARYNTTSGNYDVYRVGKTPVPFNVAPGEGYFLYTTCPDRQVLSFEAHV
jgi:hypothetical protein